MNKTRSKVRSKRAQRPRTTGPTRRITGRAPVNVSVGKVLLSACLIVKDEESTLPDCLGSLHRLVDEVVVYDTGSTDGTVELARRAGARVVQGYWDDDFGRARNACLEQCRGEWILWIDADERFVCSEIPELRAVLEKLTDLDALAVDIHNLTSNGLEQPSLHRAMRLFRKANCCWYGSLHEQVNVRAGLARELKAAPLKGPRIDHVGYMDVFLKERDKLARNLRLAEAALEQPDLMGQEGVPQMNVGRALAALGRFAEAQAYFDEAASKTTTEVTKRTALLFCAQNLVYLQRYEDAAVWARRFADACSKKGLGYYLEGIARRRLGQPQEAVTLFKMVSELSDDEGFVFPESLLHAELASALLECGKAAESTDELLLLIKQYPDVTNLTAALRVFASTGRSVEDLVKVMPEDRLDTLAAALTLVAPVFADTVARAAWERFGPKPALLAAAIHFSPLLATSRALEWSVRLRAIGMNGSCPLLAQARLNVLDPVERLRAAVTAHAAFGDATSADFALALVAGVPQEQLPSVLAEVSLLDPPLLPSLARAAAGPGAPDAGAVGTPEGRRQAVDEAVASLGHQKTT